MGQNRQRWPGVCASVSMLAATGWVLFFSSTTQAEVTLDGTLGPAGALAAPDYQIPAEVGRQVGGNLFHSFGVFSIDSQESATFTGPDIIDNVLARVTGGQSSWIDGALRSDIQGADLFLLNPAGVMFGPNASLDVNGSFHTSTADYVRLEDGVRFDAMPSAQDAVLTSAPPAAFGFLGENPAPISVQSGSFSPPSATAGAVEMEGGLSVSENETLSLVGGDLIIENGVLAAPAGRIQLASVLSADEVAITEGAFEAESLADGGNIALSDASLIDASGDGAGRVMIRGGQLTLEDQSRIQADTLGDKPGLGIDIDVKTLSLNHSRIRSWTGSSASSGTGGTIGIRADTADLSESRIDTQSRCAIDASCGNAGDVWIEAGRVRLLEGGEIASATSTAGDTGNVTVTAHEAIMIVGSTSQIATQTRSLGQGGSVRVYTPALEIRQGFVDTVSRYCFGKDCGDAGEIWIEAGQVQLLEGGTITSSTHDDGDGGNVTITATEFITIAGHDLKLNTEGKPQAFRSGIYANTQAGSGRDNSIQESTGRSGSITLMTPELNVQEGTISAESRCRACGDTGTVTIKTQYLRLQNGEFSTRSIEAGGGSIAIGARDVVLMVSSEIITSVAGGDNNAGNISITEPIAVILTEGSRIEANAFEGAGGNVHIVTAALFQSPDSVIEASSERGIEGVVEINVPDTDISGSLATLPVVFFDPTTIMTKPCAERSAADAIRFVHHKYEVLPESPYALRVYVPKLARLPKSVDRARRPTHGEIPQGGPPAHLYLCNENT